MDKHAQTCTHTYTNTCARIYCMVCASTASGTLCQPITTHVLTPTDSHTHPHTHTHTHTPHPHTPMFALAAWPAPALLQARCPRGLPEDTHTHSHTQTPHPHTTPTHTCACAC